MKKGLVSVLKAAAVFVLIMSGTSCASSRHSHGCYLAGRICSPDGKGIEGCRVENGRDKVLTDKRGYFVFGDYKERKIKLTGGKKGWASLDENIEDWDGRSLICIQLVPLEKELKGVEKMLKEKFFDEAELVLQREKNINGSEELYQFYSVLYEWCHSGNPEDKEKLMAMAGAE